MNSSPSKELLISRSMLRTWGHGNVNSSSGQAPKRMVCCIVVETEDSLPLPFNMSQHQLSFSRDLQDGRSKFLHHSFCLSRLLLPDSHPSAYTDFHHTVFYAVCPVNTPRGGAPMLPMALDALVDVMEARVESSRLEKERAAVLSEMTMVNTIEYRVECQILSTLHRENRLAKRFPIGKEKLIRSWSTDDVKSWHRTHYRPDNVLLYLVGDVDPNEAERIIAEKFGRLTAEKQGSEIKLKDIKVQASDLADAVVAGSVKAAQSWHYPPVRHDWCVPTGCPIDPKLIIPKEMKYDLQLQNAYPLDEKVDFLNTEAVEPGKKIRPHIFR
jgi:Peptidase M16 inactive domain/Insulinase (Peptidase family M16)